MKVFYILLYISGHVVVIIPPHLVVSRSPPRLKVIVIVVM